MISTVRRLVFFFFLRVLVSISSSIVLAGVTPAKARTRTVHGGFAFRVRQPWPRFWTVFSPPRPQTFRVRESGDVFPQSAPANLL